MTRQVCSPRLVVTTKVLVDARLGSRWADSGLSRPLEASDNGVHVLSSFSGNARSARVQEARSARPPNTKDTHMLKIKSGVKAGGLSAFNHGLKVKSGVKAGGMTTYNHGLKVKAGVEAGGMTTINHSQRIAA